MGTAKESRLAYGSPPDKRSDISEQSEKEWLERASVQLELSDAALGALDSILSIAEGDILVCETTCLRYAKHALASTNGLGAVWLVAPRKEGTPVTAEQLEEFGTVFNEHNAATLNSLNDGSGAFRGYTTSVPDSPFKMLVTTQYCGVPVHSAALWPMYNGFWVDMLNTEGASGAVIYPPIEEQDAALPSLREGNLEGNHYPEDFTQAVELPGGHIALIPGEPTGTVHMEDLTDPNNVWIRDITLMELAVNGGCLTPSIIRQGVEVLEETTLGDIASRISRGTTLSEKDLDIKERLHVRVIERQGSLPVLKSSGKWKLADKRSYGFTGGSYTMLDEWAYALDDDLYYVDGSCFNKGQIWPAVLNSMPKGQERYIVDEHDGAVILVSRNSKEPVVYRAIRPTLIGNSVFVIRIDADIDGDYLACWMRGSLAKSLMHNEGKILSKKILESLPVPILQDEIMRKTATYERSIDEKIFVLREEIGKLESMNRFAPLAALGEL